MMMSEKRFVHNREYFPLNVDEIIDSETGESYDCEDATDVLNELYERNRFCEEMAQNLKRENEQLKKENDKYRVMINANAISMKNLKKRMNICNNK